MTQVLSIHNLHKIEADLSPLIHRPFGFNADDTSSEFIQFAQNSGRPMSGLAADVRIPPCVVARDPMSQAWGA